MQTLILPRPTAQQHDLNNYILPLNGVIDFDQHGRPYQQTAHGRIMLSKKRDDYKYHITTH